MSAYTSNGKRRSSQTHARRVRTCSCGRVLRGNGGWTSHRRWHGREVARIDSERRETARQHREADARCGREWVCACAACTLTRAEKADGREGRLLGGHENA